MKDKKDMSERQRYFEELHKQQHKRKDFYAQQLLEIKHLLEMNEKEIRYNEGWVNFHEKSIEGHRQQIKEIPHIDEKKEQEQKLQFHVEQIEKHHKKNIEYHNKEIDALKKEVQLFEEGINRCKSQIQFLSEKISENSKL
ncbi:MAG: hypothetical protein ABIF18_01440 [archaeon]